MYFTGTFQDNKRIFEKIKALITWISTKIHCNVLNIQVFLIVYFLPHTVNNNENSEEEKKQSMRLMPAEQ